MESIKFYFRSMFLKDIQRWSKVPGQKMNINDLPTEMLLKIFSECIRTEGSWKFWENVSKVCKRWKDVAAAPSLWIEINFRSLDWNIDHLLKLGEEGLLSATRSLDLCTWLKFPRYPNIFNIETDDHLIVLLRAIRPKLKPADFIKLAPHCGNLEALDITRNMIDRPAMELLTNSCPHVNRLVMDWITDSNPLFCPEISPQSDDTLMPSTLDPVFDKWGKNLKYLCLNRCQFTGDDDLLCKLADSCPSLEEFHFLEVSCKNGEMKFRCPIDKLETGCPNLRVLKLENCRFESQNVENLKGFRKMREFTALRCLFRGHRISQILKTSMDLEHLEIDQETKTIPDIPSKKVKVLRIAYERESVEHLKRAVTKWQKTLKEITIRPTSNRDDDDLTGILEAFLQNNKEPVLHTLDWIVFSVQQPVMKRAILACQKLTRLAFREIENRIWISHNREGVEEFLNLQ